LDEYSLLQQQRTEAKSAMVRIFRFRARRAVGVLYSLVSLYLLTIAALLVSSVSVYLIVAGAFVGWLAVWYVASKMGFNGFERMAYSLEFVDGGEELVRERRKRDANSRYLLLTSFFWVAAFVVARVEGFSSLSLVFVTVWVVQAALSRVSTLSRRKNSILDPKAEDWATLAAIALIIASLVITGTGLWGILPAILIFLVSGLKSLYDAPEELTQVAS
jgi:hypothetical protein